MGMRKLLREGILVKAKSGRRLRAFLCSDILVLTEESVKALYRMVCNVLLPLLFCSLAQANSTIRDAGARSTWWSR